MSDPNASDPATRSETSLSDFSEEQIRGIVSSWKRLVVFSSILALITLLFVGLMVGSIVQEVTAPVDVLFLLGIIVILYGIGVYGTFFKRSWARTYGIVLCCVLMLGFPVGTALGIFGLFSFQGAKVLFGPNAIPYSKIKETYDRMEAERTEALFPSSK